MPPPTGGRSSLGLVLLTTSTERVPFWRDDRVLKVVAQVLFLIALYLLLSYLWGNATRALRGLGLLPSYGFLRTTAGFEIGEHVIAYEPTMSYWRAYLVGVLNTLRLVAVGVVLCTILGLLVGVARLSSNWLVRTLAGAYVELIRNTPLLLQIFFWYFAVTFSLPRPQDAMQFPGPVFLSNRGVAVPRFLPGPELPLLAGALGLGLALAVLAYRSQMRREVETGHRRYPLLSGLAIFLVLGLAGWLVTRGQAFAFSSPELGTFNFRGGLTLTPEYFALLFALTIYTAAFIAEIVRGAILSIPRGQSDAGLAVGLTRAHLLRLVILPQTLRIIVPPLTSQYLNLTKNSSLAVAIAYPDIVSVANTTLNQTGRALEMISLVMATYLSFSLLTAAFMNWYNARVRLVER